MFPLASVVLDLYRDVFPHIRDKHANVFLIGKGTSYQTSARKKLRTELTRVFGTPPIRVHYPEDLFTELVNFGKMDLLTLENLLARSVHAVVICLESPGSIAELGAFANHDALRERLIVVADRKYRQEQSFIRLGPLRLLERLDNSAVQWWDLQGNDFEPLGRRVRSLIRKRFQGANTDLSLSNPLAAEDFILALLYTVGSISVSGLKEVLQIVEPSVSEEVETICISALRSLFRQRWVILQHGHYDLNRDGVVELRRRVKEKRSKGLAGRIDQLRVEVLNYSLRKKRTTFEGEALRS